MIGLSTKDVVLSILEKNRGSYVSSRDIISEAGVSRNAVWKAVNELKKSGYDIESVTNKGYCLSSESDVISVQAIGTFLKNKSLADRIVIYDELASTNKAAKLSLITGEDDRNIIIARRQTEGVGHSSEHYESPEGGIYISIIITPEKHSNKKLKASAIGKKVAEVIEKQSGHKAELDKSTNRIYINKKKVCGILTEYIADLETGDVSCYIVGIGIKMKNMQKNRMIAKVIEGILQL